MAAKNGPNSAKSAVSIRMYCQGLGDCFLLSFPRPEDAAPYYVLIDCGVLQRTDDEPERVRAVAEDIKQTTSTIDLLIVTHEHWDHVAGFSHAKDIFEQIKIRKVWLSWAENPNDPDARIVKTQLGKKKTLVQKALMSVAKLRLDGTNGSKSSDDLTAAVSIMDFFGPDHGTPAVEMALGSDTVAAAPKKKKGMSLGETMDWLRAQVDPADFCVPGEVRSLPGLEGIKVYVLGPPKDVAMIRKMDPKKDEGYRLLADKLSLEGTLKAMSADADRADAANSDVDRLSPFETRYGIGIEDAHFDPFFRDFYGFDDDAIGDPKNDWRKIDDADLSDVSRLALQLDTGVNNTSLALAFELPNGRTLIFPGDAQIGNWLSWDKVNFEEKKEGEKTTSQSLMKRAAFYKVGHHGSHNATRKVGGLESMTSGDLIAMIPTDEKFALTQSPPHGWKMPFFELLKALKQYTSDRIIRADLIWEKPETSGGVGDGAWEAFRHGLRFSPKTLLPDMKDHWIYVECDIPY